MHFGRNRQSLFRLLVFGILLPSGFPQCPSAEAANGNSVRSFTSVVVGSSKSGKQSITPHNFATILAGSTRHDGFIALYRKDSHLYAILSPHDLDQDLLVLISIARGIAQRPLFSGATWEFGNDWVCQFRRVGDKVHFVRRNVRYRADPGSPAAMAVEEAYSDSILTALPIVAEKSDGSLLVDLSNAYLSDLPNIQKMLPGFEFCAEKSSWANVQGFAKNIELQVDATYTSDGTTDLEAVPDSRSLTIRVHYSISRLSQSNYQPRLADDRIGYFLSVSKNFSSPSQEDRFERYINRWHLEKKNPRQELSEPKEPIVFWLEKTVPHKYRETIRAGILEWNKAFERIGIRNAIVVRQQADDASWHPGDIRYNTFRWITSGLSVAMGPTRVNPRTGQILDADIVFDADYLQTWKRKYEYLSPEGVSLMTGGSVDLASSRRQHELSARGGSRSHSPLCRCQHSFSHQLAMSSTVLAHSSRSKREIERLTIQGIKKTVMHEVGHTLGLRHNFKGSTLYSLKDAHARSTSEQALPLAGSVMDYLPALFVKDNPEQNSYYSPTIGPYDYWAIEYGYRQFDASSTYSERPYLQAIASRSAEPGHAYATDEETRGIDADPHSGVYDFGDDMIAFAENQAALVADSWDGLTERVTSEGDGYQHARQAFGVMMATHGRAMFNASKYIGGIHTTHSHRGDPGAEAPFKVVDAKVQRRALALLSRHMFSDQPYEKPLQLCNHFAATHWNHWGNEIAERTDFPVHQSVLNWQDRILEKLLSPLTLTRLHDSELLVPAEADAYTVAELMQTLVDDIFAELQSSDTTAYSNRQPAISSLRRNLQMALIKRLEALLLPDVEVPSDCRAIAVLQLKHISERSSEFLYSGAHLDTYSRAHLAEIVRRVEQQLKTTL